MTDYKLDRISFEVGMINCFVEMVANGVKTLALSPPISPENYNLIGPLSDKIVKGFNINSYLEKSLIITELQSEDFTKGKWSILYYDKNEVLDQYINLKTVQKELMESGNYDDMASKELSRNFMRLLSYTEEKINMILDRKEPEEPYLINN